MPSYSDERREHEAGNLFPPRNPSVREVARQAGIAEPTAYKWRKGACEQGRCLPKAGDGSTAARSLKGQPKGRVGNCGGE